MKEPPSGYSVKIMNPSKKSMFQTVRLQSQPKYCKTLVELKEFVTTALPQSLDNIPSVEELGYVEPGHGAKGKRCWLHTDADLKEMYEQHKRKKEVLLWCYSEKLESKKAESVESGPKVARASVYNNHTKKMSKSMRLSRNWIKSTMGVTVLNKCEPGHT